AHPDPAGTSEPEEQKQRAEDDEDKQLATLLEQARRPRLARLEGGRHEKLSTKIEDREGAYEQENRELASLYAPRAATHAEQFVVGFGQGVAQLAKAPEFAAKWAKHLGVLPDVIARHSEGLKKLGDWGRSLEEGAAALEDPRFAPQ